MGIVNYLECQNTQKSVSLRGREGFALVQVSWVLSRIWAALNSHSDRQSTANTVRFVVVGSTFQVETRDSNPGLNIIVVKWVFVSMHPQPQGSHRWKRSFLRCLMSMVTHLRKFGFSRFIYCSFCRLMLEFHHAICIVLRVENVLKGNFARKRNRWRWL